MKILIVCQYYYPENFTITKIAEGLVNNGHRVDVLTGKPNYGYNHILPEYKNIKEQTINGVNVHRVNLFARKHSRASIILNYLSFWNNSKKWVRKCKEKYDIVYTMTLSPVIMCCAGNLYKKKFGVRHIIHCVDLWPESVLVTHAVNKNSVTYKILYKWSKSIYQKADRILIGSPSFAGYFENILNIKEKEIYYVPQPSLVENTLINPYEYGEGLHILYCGNLGIIQLINLIPETMKLLKNENIYFHVIGMGPLSDNLEKQIKESGLSHNLIYHGPIIASKAASFFASADAIYVSLKSEGVVGKTIPNKLMMSMAFGKPIIAVLKGDGKKVLEESGGALFADENADSIKNAILALRNMSQTERNNFGKLNKNYYDSNFALNKVVNTIEKFLK